MELERAGAAVEGELLRQSQGSGAAREAEGVAGGDCQSGQVHVVVVDNGLAHS